MTTSSGTEAPIDELIKKIEAAEIVAADVAVSPEFREGLLRAFVQDNSAQIIHYLQELKDWLEKQAATGQGGTHDFQRTIVEGFSENSLAEALSEALDKAAKFFNDQEDVAIILEQLIELPHGGYRATLEVRVVPLNMKHKLHVQGADVQYKRIHDHDYHAQRKFEEGHIRHLVFDHFAANNCGSMVPIPEYFLINVNDAYLLNHAIEKAFLKAGHTLKLEDMQGPQQILVRTRAPHPHPDPHPEKE